MRRTVRAASFCAWLIWLPPQGLPSLLQIVTGCAPAAAALWCRSFSVGSYGLVLAEAAGSLQSSSRVIIPFHASSLQEHEKFTCIGYRDIPQPDLSVLQKELDMHLWETIDAQQLNLQSVNYEVASDSIVHQGSSAAFGSSPEGMLENEEDSNSSMISPPVFHAVRLPPSYRCERNLLSGKYRTILFEVSGCKH